MSELAKTNKSIKKYLLDLKLGEEEGPKPVEHCLYLDRNHHRKLIGLGGAVKPR